jgi:hypothetical protein
MRSKGAGPSSGRENEVRKRGRWKDFSAVRYSCIDNGRESMTLDGRYEERLSVESMR